MIINRGRNASSIKEIEGEPFKYTLQAWKI